ncbi:hypothetical protein AQUCO_05800190v1 [Aquilegia coerulea]|uniref:DYW domain-containing protein n=1 Tax=Aquilegia coerulea TaxID=218851 RepID=A0A2G5CFB1_AQUCA|nr:hypothetical protein AQUCO_05800190v1 [Aquilegia coerulea]
MKALHHFTLTKRKTNISRFSTLSTSLSTPQTQETHFISLIHSAKTSKQLQQIHTQLLINNLSQNSRIATQLITSFTTFKSIDYALSIFRHFHHPNSFIFNSIIRGLFENAQFKNSVSHFVFMLELEILPDRLTFPFVLKSAAALVQFRLGRALHAQIDKRGVDFDSFVRVSLVDMYVKLGHLKFGLKLFDETPERNKLESILLWNVLINGCCKDGDVDKASEIFEAMPERNVGSWNSMINGFMKKGDLEHANLLFDQMPEKNVVSWTTMITGLSQNEDHEQALRLYRRMLDEGVKPNNFTVVSALSACARLGALGMGVKIDEYITQRRFQLNTEIGNALVDMFAKCGKIEHASRIFSELKKKDLLSWTIMISGWAMHGCSELALQYFDNMISTGVKPDDVVFLAVLTACSHSGLVDQGLHFFNSMRLDYSIKPTVKHYTCMVDLFGRTGQLEEALKFIESIPVKTDFVVWGALFCACRAHKNIKMAELTSEKLLQLEPRHPGSHVFLSNIYAEVGRWQDVERVRLSMKTKGIEKPPGWSYIEVEGLVHRFVASDHAHKRAKEVYTKLEELTTSARTQGYTPDTEWVLHNIEDEEKEDSLGSHSEKLALAYGLISTSDGTTIRIVKNLRVCGDCHSLMKYASVISGREIILRDTKRFHCFKKGVCTCGDYW